MARLVCVLGTRPEAVKMAPVVHALRRRSWAEVLVLSTGQHRRLLDEVLPWLHLAPDADLALMHPGAGLAEQLGRMVQELDHLFRLWRPDAILVQGDTTTAWAAAQASFYRQIALGHIEAGLRTGTLAQPFPEEFHRRAVALVARWHFAPTPQSRANLLAEGVPPQRIFLTGNTVIDALQRFVPDQLPDLLGLSRTIPLVLITLHRREQLQQRVVQVAQAARKLLARCPQAVVAWIEHPHPGIAERVNETLPVHPRLFRLPSLEYPVFLGLLARCRVVWTDSGGVQEEAAALRRPCLVLRDRTERTEGLQSGAAQLAGCNPETLLALTGRLLEAPLPGQAGRGGPCPYGDGRAAERIADVLEAELVAGKPKPLREGVETGGARA